MRTQNTFRHYIEKVIYPYIRTLGLRLRTVTHSVRHLETSLSTQERDLHYLQATASTQGNRILTTESRLTTHDTRLDTIDTTILGHGGRISIAEHDIRSIETIVHQHSARIVDQSADLGIYETRFTTIEGSITEVNDTVGQHAISLVDLNDTLGTHDTRLTTTEGTITSHGIRLTTAEGDITAIEDMLGGTGGGGTSIIDTISDHESRIFDTEQDVSALYTLTATIMNQAPSADLYTVIPETPTVIHLDYENGPYQQLTTDESSITLQSVQIFTDPGVTGELVLTLTSTTNTTVTLDPSINYFGVDGLMVLSGQTYRYSFIKRGSVVDLETRLLTV